MRKKSEYGIFEIIIYCLLILIIIGQIFAVWYVKKQSTHNYLPLYIRIFLTLLCVGIGIMFILENKNIWRQFNMRKKYEFENLKDQVKRLEERIEYLENKDMKPYCEVSYHLWGEYEAYLIYINNYFCKKRKIQINSGISNFIPVVKVIKENKDNIYIKFDCNNPRKMEQVHNYIVVDKHSEKIMTYKLEELAELKELENEEKKKRPYKIGKIPKVNTNR